MEEFRVKLGNGKITVGDVMLFTPTKNITICEPGFEKAFVYIDYITKDCNEACVHTLDNRHFQAINTDCLSYVDYRDIKMLISEAQKYSKMNDVIWELQVINDLRDGFDDLLMRFDDINRDDIIALSYDIQCIIEVLQYDRNNINLTESWTCTSLRFLETLYNYCYLIGCWYSRF